MGLRRRRIHAAQLAQAFFHRKALRRSSPSSCGNKDDTPHQEHGQARSQTHGLEDAEFTRSTLSSDLKATAWAVAGAVCCWGRLGVANTMIMSVFTRIREIAILRVTVSLHLQIAAMIFGDPRCVLSWERCWDCSPELAFCSSSSRFPLFTAMSTYPFNLSLMLIVILLALSTGIAGGSTPRHIAMRIRAVEALRFE